MVSRVYAPEYHDRYYAGFLLDPDGNSVEAVHDGRPRDCAAVIDHIWLRVGDLEASKRFWVTIGPALGLHISRELPARFHVAGSGRSFALVDGGDRTRDVHIAFPAASTPWSASFTAWRSPPAAATTVLRASGRSTTRLLRRLRTRPRRQQHRGGQPQPLVS